MALAAPSKAQTLAQAIADAHAHNPELAEAAARHDALAQTPEQARAAGRVTVDLGAEWQTGTADGSDMMLAEARVLRAIGRLTGGAYGDRA